MQSLNIERSKQSPLVIFKSNEHYLKISGNSYMNNAYEFYSPIFYRLSEYFKIKTKEKTSIYLDINVCNSQSAVILSELFDLLNTAQRLGFDIDIIWYYHTQNDMALESGEDYQDDFKLLNFNLISYETVA